MSNEAPERIETDWPDGEAEVPTGPVVRLIYASRSAVHVSVLDEMRRIRDHAVGLGRLGVRPPRHLHRLTAGDIGAASG